MSSLPDAVESYWMDTTSPTSYPLLDDDLEVDAAVIGGGIAGLCAAWELTRTGRSVAVLDANRIAAAVTGHTTAKLSALHTLVYARLRSSHGSDAARWYAQSQQDAVEEVARTASQLGIDCELERVPAYTYAESADSVDDLRAEADAASDAGLDATFVTETGLPFPVAGAVRVADQAQFHPRRYLLGLAEEMTRRGAQILEQTRVTGLHEGSPCRLDTANGSTVTGLHEGSPCRLDTANGSTVTARDVVVATHYPVFDRALLFSRLEPRRELVVAAAIAADSDPGGMYITQEQNTRSVRTAPYTDGQRLLIVTGEKFKPGAGEVSERFQRLAAWARERFGVADIAYRWAAQDNNTTDSVPYVGPLHVGSRHTYVATGFGGWGMTNGVMAGTLLAALISGKSPAWAKLYDPRRLKPLREAGPTLKLQAEVARRFVGDRLRGSEVGSVEEIPAGSGAVMRVGGQRCAVYRGEDGAVSAVSAVCTHLGCIVGFNDAERAWECPCHGSRFAVDGTVLQGPANKPLERRDVPDASAPRR